MPSSNPHLSLVHTGEIHCPTFEKLILQIAPEITYEQFVREDLLLRAGQAGGVTKEIAEETEQFLLEVADRGTDGILMTCSTLGIVSDQTQLNIPITRVDRALARESFRQGSNILVLVAAESTVPATTQLFETEAAKASGNCAVQIETVEGAWAHYLNGDMAQYHQVIANAIASKLNRYDKIALGQISMNPALNLLSGKTDQVLTSPELGLRAALRSISK